MDIDKIAHKIVQDFVLCPIEPDGKGGATQHLIHRDEQREVIKKWLKDNKDLFSK